MGSFQSSAASGFFSFWHEIWIIYVVLRTILQNVLLRIVDLLCSCKDMGLQTLPFASVNTLLEMTTGKLFFGV